MLAKKQLKTAQKQFKTLQNDKHFRRDVSIQSTCAHSSSIWVSGERSGTRPVNALQAMLATVPSLSDNFTFLLGRPVCRSIVVLEMSPEGLNLNRRYAKYFSKRYARQNQLKDLSNEDRNRRLPSVKVKLPQKYLLKVKKRRKLI